MSEREDPAEPLLRIGELARRAGVPTATLRAWERRYGVVSPHRGESGYRLYTAEDERRLRAMVGLIEGGLAPAEAARQLQGRHGELPEAGAEARELPLEAMRASLLEALIDFDEAGANRELDRAIGSLSVEALVGEVLLPVLREIGERWAGRQITIGQEHFASTIVRGRLLGLARGWGEGAGPLALLACPSGELHDLGVICFGLLLSVRGWRVAFLGGDTPAESILQSATRTRPAMVLVFAMYGESLERIEPTLERIAASSALLLAGPGSDPERSRRVGARYLEGDAVTAAATLAA